MEFFSLSLLVESRVEVNLFVLSPDIEGRDEGETIACRNYLANTKIY
jgi:hypothetical protein